VISGLDELSTIHLRAGIAIKPPSLDKDVNGMGLGSVLWCPYIKKKAILILTSF